MDQFVYNRVATSQKWNTLTAQGDHYLYFKIFILLAQKSL